MAGVVTEPPMTPREILDHLAAVITGGHCALAPAEFLLMPLHVAGKAERNEVLGIVVRGMSLLPVSNARPIGVMQAQSPASPVTSVSATIYAGMAVPGQCA